MIFPSPSYRTLARRPRLPADADNCLHQVASYLRSVPLTTMSTWWLPHREQTSLSRHSRTVACSVATSVRGRVPAHLMPHARHQTISRYELRNLRTYRLKADNAYLTFSTATGYFSGERVQRPGVNYTSLFPLLLNNFIVECEVANRH